MYVYGYFPDTLIDHIDGNPSNNKLENLRDASNIENCQNKHLQKNNTSGYRGVSYVKSVDKWRAGVSGNYLGVYDTAEDASNMCKKFAEKNFKLFYDETSFDIKV